MTGRLRNGILAAIMTLLIVCGAVLSKSVKAGGIPVIDVANLVQAIMQVLNDATQIANQATQIANQVQQYQNMATNTLNIPNQLWGQIQNDLQPLMQIVQQGQAIAFTMQNLGQQFQARFPDFNNWMNQNFGAQDFMQSYRDWYTTQRDAISGALQVANLQAGQFQNENQVMAQLNAMGNNAQGRMQALQVGAQIANQQVQQMQKLRQLVMSQMNMQANYMAAEAAKDAAKQARAERFWDTNRGTQVGNSAGFFRP